MKNEKKQTAVEYLIHHIRQDVFVHSKSTKEWNQVFQQAKKMDKEQRGYTKEDVLKAGEMGEINHHDTKHIVTYLDEAKEFNETYGGGEK